MFCDYTRPRYQVSVYKTIGPLDIKAYDVKAMVFGKSFEIVP